MKKTEKHKVFNFANLVFKAIKTMLIRSFNFLIYN